MSSPRITPQPEARLIGLTKLEWVCVALAIGIAHGFLIHLAHYPAAGDANGYAQAGFDILTGGVQSKWFQSHLRTYAYPYFLSLLYRLSGATHVPVPVIIFAVQLLFFIGAAFVLRIALSRLSPRAGEIGFCGVMLNYYCLLFVPYGLTENLSLTLVMVTSACWLMLQRNRESIWLLLIGSLLVGLAVMVRPANLFLAATWAIACLVVFRWERAKLVALSARVVLMVVAMALPAVPQLLNNFNNYDRATPLVVADLGGSQLRWGIAYSKYATGIEPFVGQPQIFYDNPFATDAIVDADDPLRWYLQNPLVGTLTIALHIFNMTDQDLLFPYSRDLHPWYRIPLGVINHGAVALGLLGLALLWRNAVSQRTRPSLERVAVVSVLLGSCCAVYAMTAVEMRFGLPLLLVLFPLAGYTIHAMKEREARVQWRAFGVAASYVIAALLVSQWVRGFAAQITPP